MDTTKLHDTFGIEISGVDLRRDVDDASFDRLVRLFDTHSLLLFRDQELSEAEQRAVVSRFGPINAETGDYYLSNRAASGQGELVLHSDHCFYDQPLRGLALYANEAARAGGATLFVSAAAACRALPGEIRAQLVGRAAVHVYDPRVRLGEAYDGPDVPPGGYRAVHPAIWEHPVTGISVLYLNPWMTRGLVGMAEDDSRTLLARVFEHLSDPAFSYRHAWRRGDFVLWDNIALLHAREAYDPAQPRVLHRLELALAASSDTAPADRSVG